MYNRVLLTLDGSPLAEQAIGHAVDLASRYEAELHVLRVVEPMTSTRRAGSVPATTLKSAEQKLKEMAEEYLSQIASRIDDPAVKMATRSGIAYQAIIDYAEQNMIDVIVMSTHGRSGLTRWLLGSVTDHVVRGAAIPVVVVPVNVKSVPAHH